MTNPFQPQFQQPAQTPAQAVHAPAQAPVQTYASAPVHPQAVQQPAQAGGLDAPNLYLGHNSPLLPHCVGNFDFDVVGFSGSPGALNNPAIHVSLKVRSSDSPQVTIGDTYRVMCDYQYTVDQPAPGKEGLAAAKELGCIVAAIFSRDVHDPAFSKTQACRQLQAHDFGAAPARIRLHVGSLRPGVKDPSKMFRKGVWLPPQAV